MLLHTHISIWPNTHTLIQFKINVSNFNLISIIVPILKEPDSLIQMHVQNIKEIDSFVLSM